MHDRFGPALLHGHLQCLDYQLGAQVRRHRPAHDPPAEHVEDDGQVEEARQGRNVGDVGDPQAIRRVSLEAALDPVRRRPTCTSRRVVRGPRRRLTPTMPAARITRATRLRPTATPASASSA